MSALSAKDFLNVDVIIIGCVSILISVGILMIYYNFRVKSFKRPNATSDSKSGGVSRKTGGDWGRIPRAIGIDLGSYDIKAHLYQDGTARTLSCLRAVATFLPPDVQQGGLKLGELDTAKIFADCSYFALTRDMQSEAAPIQMGSIELRPYQAVGKMLQFIVGGDRIVPSPIGISVPPYLRDVVPALYASAVAAQLNRFFIFSQSAALMAALLRFRKNEQQDMKVKPPKHVVFLDMGRSGLSAYLCEVRDHSGTTLHSAYRTEGIQSFERVMVDLLIKNFSEEQKADPCVMAAVIESAMELRHDFANTPAYLASSAKKMSRSKINEDITIEMDREQYLELLDFVKKDIMELLKVVQDWLSTNDLQSKEIELVLTGGGFKVKELKVLVETSMRWKRVLHDKVSISQGLALLAAMKHPKFSEQRLDVTPLFEERTVDEVGMRTVRESTTRHSFLTPLLTRTSSSNFRSNSNTAKTLNRSGSLS